MPRGRFTNGSDVMKATLQHGKTLFLYGDRADYEATLEELENVSRLMSEPRATFTGKQHDLRHNGEIATCWTILGKMQ